MRGLKRLQDAGFEPRIITVLHPAALDCAEEYSGFYRDHGLTEVSFSIDEQEGAHEQSSFVGSEQKSRVTAFLVKMLETASLDGFPLRIREIERIAYLLAGATMTRMSWLSLGPRLSSLRTEACRRSPPS
jgi:Arylsulfatase regulator (Fe-S oxidoreductase)